MHPCQQSADDIQKQLVFEEADKNTRAGNKEGGAWILDFGVIAFSNFKFKDQRAIWVWLVELKKFLTSAILKKVVQCERC
jgi:hypothetical protein